MEAETFVTAPDDVIALNVTDNTFYFNCGWGQCFRVLFPSAVGNRMIIVLQSLAIYSKEKKTKTKHCTSLWTICAGLNEVPLKT